MSQQFTTKCGGCHSNIYLDADQINLYLVINEGIISEGSILYYTCPDCQLRNKRYISKEEAVILIDGGVNFRTSDENCGGYIAEGWYPPEWYPQDIIEATREAVKSEVKNKYPPHPENRPEGPPLSRDDLLNFHWLLKMDYWFKLEMIFNGLSKP